MGVDDTWVINALRGILPEQTLQLLQDHVLHPSSTVRTVSAHAVVGMQRLARLLEPAVAPVAERGARALQDSPDVVFFAFLLALLFLAFQVLVWVQRTISFFTRLAFRAVLWCLLGLALMAVWQRGPEAVAADLAVLVRRLAVYAAMVKDIWLNEYRKYDAQTRAGSFGPGAGGPPVGSGRSAGYSGRRNGS
ncbi:putative nuclear pore assembly and biogenesis [Rosellinia necatrix]|uniref:Putative nuclear pore assembly and biogenesis n=1 Tax=Rosellinia necatrix TaxID=77044 RepID=A0A1S7UHQ5_ROSNE|nr:putative nuclear pore assembly and biogenesis [Rosellinia necatrix]